MPHSDKSKSKGRAQKRKSNEEEEEHEKKKVFSNFQSSWNQCGCVDNKKNEMGKKCDEHESKTEMENKYLLHHS